MPRTLAELHTLLEAAPQAQRTELRDIIEAPFGTSPGHLCDHLLFLRAGAIGQHFDGRSYKQLVTDVADHAGIDWKPLIKGTSWHQLSAEDIERVIVATVDPEHLQRPDKQPHLPDVVTGTLAMVLIHFVRRIHPAAAILSGPISAGLDHLFSSLATDWRKLLAAVIYIHQAIRPREVPLPAGADLQAGLPCAKS